MDVSTKRLTAAELEAALQDCFGPMGAASLVPRAVAAMRALELQHEQDQGARAGLYSERASCVALIVALGAMIGWRFGYGLDPQAPDWPVVYVDTPAGQLSWHFSRDDYERCFPGGLPRYAGEWDLHDAPEKYRRCDLIVRGLLLRFLAEGGNNA